MADDGNNIVCTRATPIYTRSFLKCIKRTYEDDPTYLERYCLSPDMKLHPNSENDYNKDMLKEKPAYVIYVALMKLSKVIGCAILSAPRPTTEAPETAKQNSPVDANTEFHHALEQSKDRFGDEFFKDGMYRELKALFIDPNHRKKGIPSKLLKKAFHEADIAREAMWLTCTEESKPFYEDSGFTLVKEDQIKGTLAQKDCKIFYLVRNPGQLLDEDKLEEKHSAKPSSSPKRSLTPAEAAFQSYSAQITAMDKRERTSQP